MREKGKQNLCSGCCLDHAENMSGSVHLASPAINKYDRPSLDFVPPRLKIPAGTIEESVIGGGTIDHVTNKKGISLPDLKSELLLSSSLSK